MRLFKSWTAGKMVSFLLCVCLVVNVPGAHCTDAGFLAPPLFSGITIPVDVEEELRKLIDTYGIDDKTEDGEAVVKKIRAFLEEKNALTPITSEAIADYIRERVGVLNDTGKDDAAELLLEEVRLANKTSELKELLENDKKQNYEAKDEVLIKESTTLKQLKNKKVKSKGIVFLPDNAEIFVVGDTHGDAESTRSIIKQFKKKMLDDQKPYIVFLGDYVNNGLASIENLVEVLTLKSKHPDNVILLSGNHEFGVTYRTIVKEMFSTHWENAERNRYPNKDPPKLTHYGHLRTDLIRKYGIRKGEEIHDAFVDWGRSLPYICMIPKRGIMMCHSIGLPKGKDKVTLNELDEAKEENNREAVKDKDLIDNVGYEAWKKMQITIHSAMVNNRKFTPELLGKFAEMKIKTIIVGHTHFRSDAVDTEFYDPQREKPVKVPGIQLITVCSSRMDSPDAGHYMFQEMIVEAKPYVGKTKDGKPVNGARYNERVEKDIPNRDGNAEAFYLAISPSKGTVDLERAKRPVVFGKEYYELLKERINTTKNNFSINPEAAIKEFGELAILINYLKPSTDAEKQLFKELLIKRSDVARDISYELMKNSREDLRTVLSKQALSGLESHTDFMVSTDKVTRKNGNETLEKARKSIGEWLDQKNNIPSYIRQGIYRGMLEGRYEDLLYAFGFGWRKFGTAGIRNQAVMSEFPVLLKKELKEFAKNPHAPILTGPNMINAVTLLQQVAALTKIIKDFQEKIKGIGDINQAAEELDIDLEFLQNIENNTVTIAYDSRLNGKYFAHLLATAFMIKGIRVNLFDAPAGVPAGAAASKGWSFFGKDVGLVNHKGQDVKGSVFGILISASHSEAHYNGFKAFRGDQVSQVDAETKKMILDARENISYENLKELLDLDKGKLREFDQILNSDKLTLFGKDRNVDNYPKTGYVSFYTFYYRHLRKRSLLPADSSEQVSEVKAKLPIVYSAFYGVGAEKAADIAGFLKDMGFKGTRVVDAQTKDMNGLFPGHVSPDPGVPAGWNSNILQYFAQHINEHRTEGGDKGFLEQLTGAIKFLNDTYMAATDPDADRAGIMLHLPKGVEGNVKRQLIRWIEANPKMVREKIFNKTFPEEKFSDFVKTLKNEFEDMLLLTANEAWTMLAYYKLLIREKAGKLNKNKLYTILKTHVTTDGLEQVAEHFRKKGYNVHVVNTYVGFTELAKKSRDLYAIARTANRIAFLLKGEGIMNARTAEAFINELNRLKAKMKKLNNTLKSRVPPKTAGIPIINGMIADLNENRLEEALAKCEIISRMENIIACEESNGYGELGEYVPDYTDPEKGSVVNAHIAEKDGGLALYLFFEMLVWGKVEKNMSGYELFNDMLKTIGYCATDNQMAKYPGVSGMQEKADAIQSFEMEFSVIAGKMLDRNESIILSGKALDRKQRIMLYGKYRLKGIEIFRDAKNERVYRGFPEEGVRLILEKDGYKMTTTFRPSGTGDSNRDYNWVYGGNFDTNKYGTVEDYRLKVLKMLAELRNHFFGVPAVREGFAEKPNKQNPSLLWALKMKGTMNHMEVIREALGLKKDQMKLTATEERLIAYAREYTAANKEMKEDEKIKKAAWIKKAKQENIKAWEEYLASPEAKDYPVKQRVMGVDIPKAFVEPLWKSLRHYLAGVVEDKAPPLRARRVTEESKGAKLVDESN